MKSKDTIALWILALFLIVPFGNAFSSFTDAIKLSSSKGEILWSFVVLLFVGASGLFLIKHFVNMSDELNQYKSKNKNDDKR